MPEAAKGSWSLADTIIQRGCWQQLKNRQKNWAGTSMCRFTIKAGKSNPRHCHPKSEEVLYLLKGRLNHTSGDKTITMSAGDVITAPPRIFHNAACTDAEMVAVYSQSKRRFELEKSR